MLNVEMLSTGDEVLHGQIIDTNAAWLADFFFNQGLPLTRRNTVGDDLDALVAILRERSEQADVLIVNGGLGPTSDDLSALAAATAKGEGLILHPEWLETMTRFFAERGRPMAESNRKQAEIPASAEMINNPVGTACGFAIQLNRCLMFFTPGVPSEFKVMVEQEILPRLRQRFTFIGYQRPGLRARDQTAIGLIAAVGKDFLTRSQPQPLPGANQLATGQTYKDKLRITVPHRAGNSVRQRRIFRRLVIEHAVRLHVAHHTVLSAHHRLQRPNLVEHLSVDRLRRQIHRRATKVFPVRKAGVSAYRHAVFNGIAHALQHGLRIARVKATGDIDRGDQHHQLSICAAALAQIGIQINLYHQASTPAVRDNAADPAAP